MNEIDIMINNGNLVIEMVNGNASLQLHKKNGSYGYVGIAQMI